MLCFHTMLFRILTLILLQGVLMSHVKSKSNPSSVPASKVLGSSGSEALQPSETSRSRQKRCTCYSYTDKECVYYCHLDIIWINTPERTVLYGMSNYRGPKRRRRDAAAPAPKGDWPQTRRCICAVTHADQECQHFCLPSPHQARPARSLHRVPCFG
ncbi:endothelin-3b [Girardinichthys multiradiatus]|uniref:endothelin-3b n=1 Tax=Girardinichthys multiradiatus TaxID=208333 RepID=UPI001FAC9291|nr:endothelin-3b [Girardinichthys multiradiatus]